MSVIEKKNYRKRASLILGCVGHRMSSIDYSFAKAVNHTRSYQFRARIHNKIEKHYGDCTTYGYKNVQTVTSFKSANIHKNLG